MPQGSNGRRAALLYLAAAVAIYFLFFFHLTAMGLVGPDEPRYAWVGREMARSGDWITPRLWGRPWFEKPALLYWMAAGAFRLGLDNDLAPRLPVAILSALFLLFFYRRLRAEFGATAAAYAAAILATSAGWAAYSRAAVFDIPLAATFSAAMLCLLGWIERGETRGIVPFAALLGLSMLAKGLVGPVLAALTIFGWSARMGWRSLRAFWRPLAVLIFLAVPAPWYALCYARNGSAFLTEFFWRQHVERYAAGALAHPQPLWFFLPVLAAGLLPWTPLVAALGWAGLWRERRCFFLALWAAVTLVFFSFSRDKLPHYILPALPPIAALAGLALSRMAPSRIALPLCALLLGLLPFGASVLPEALDAGLGRALAQARLPALAVTFAVVFALGIWALERARRRPFAIAAIALATVAGYASIAQSTFPLIDQVAGTRPLWLEIQARGTDVCLGDTPRRVVYGLDYYAAGVLPTCEDHPARYRIEDHRIVPAP
ncbi:MAG TPA: glycosyltransferase family 39 protein [Bryobacterales bacterium]|nr:glycosyltransferase family 39 protein [Bryobacterales bacterium]